MPAVPTGYAITPDIHADSVIAVELVEGVPVLIHHGGRYPTLVRLSDRADTSGPCVSYIDCAIYGSFEQPHATVTAHAANATASRSRRTEAITVFSGAMNLTRSVDAAIEEARPHFLRAVEMLPQVSRMYAEAAEIRRRIDAYPRPMTRADYEAACAEFKIEPKPDAKLSSWGVFGFPEYGLDVLPRVLIDQSRAFVVEREAREAAEAQEQAEARARLDETERLMRVLKDAPVARTYETMIVGRHVLGRTWIEDGALCTVTKAKPATVTEDDPSCFGSHLLGCEGMAASRVTVEVRVETP